MTIRVRRPALAIVCVMELTGCAGPEPLDAARPDATPIAASARTFTAAPVPGWLGNGGGHGLASTAGYQSLQVGYPQKTSYGQPGISPAEGD